MKNLIQMTDDELVNLFENGNSNAFETLLSRYQSKVYSYIYLIVRNKEPVSYTHLDVYKRQQSILSTSVNYGSLLSFPNE